MDQKISDWLIEIMFLGKIETAKDEVLNLGLMSWALAQVTEFGAWGFLFDNCLVPLNGTSIFH